MPVNQKELARVAGVSQVTVSRVLRGHPSVAPALRERVLAARKQYGYYPRADARAMRLGKFRQIACVVTRFGPKGTSHTIYSGYLDPVVDYLSSRNYAMIFETFHLNIKTGELVDAPRLLSELAVDGILGITAASPVLGSVDRRLDELGAPAVWVNRDPEPDIACVVSDEAANARILTRHLIDLGHERIGYFGGKGRHYSTLQRRNGVRRELESAGLDTSYTEFTEPNREMAHLEALLDQASRPTALICYNLQYYYMAAQAILLRGLRVPRDQSLCYFASAWELPTFAHYPVTVMAIPELQMARAGAELLLKTIEKRGQKDPIQPIVGELSPGITTSPPGEDIDRRTIPDLRENRYSLGRRIADSANEKADNP